MESFRLDTSSLNNVLGLVFGRAPRHKVGQEIVVCTVDGCMGETLTVRYKGVITGKVRVPCYGAGGDGKIPAVEIRVTEAVKSDRKPGDRTTELVDRMRGLVDGTLIIAN